MDSIWPVRERPENLQRPEVVNQIEFPTLLAMAKYHKESKVGAATSGAKASFTKDTLPSSTLFREQRDDGVKKLHEARFLRLPLADPKKWWSKVPLSRTHKYRNIPLKFMGCQGQVAEKTIENAHDRAIPAQLKHYFSENISVSSKPFKKLERKDEDGLSTIYDFTWEEPSTMSHIQDAIVNFQAVQFHLWPTDPTGIIITKLFCKYKWIQNAENHKDKVTASTAFFNSVMRENAGRAVRGETLMSFEEQERLLKDVLVSHDIPCSVPVGRIPKLDTSKPFKRTPEPKQSSSGFKKPGATPKFQTAKVGGLGCCYGYNDNTCTNPTRTKAGCKNARGVEFAHNCNKWLTDHHCLGDHPRTKHV